MGNYVNILRTTNYIHGKWADQSIEKHTIYNKFSQLPIVEISIANENDVEKVLSSTSITFEKYRKSSAGERSDILLKLKDKLSAKKEEFAKLIVMESGKPIDYARIEIDRALFTLESTANEALRFGGEYVPIDFGAGAGKTAFTKRIPIGPILCITPFNFPLNLAIHKIAPALACGCTVILKPPPQSPLTILAFCGLCEEAGIPPGLLNVVYCPVNLTEKMALDPRIKMLSFTGSASVGWYLKKLCSDKKVILELGGNAAVIIDETADLLMAAKQIAKASYLYSGQICISTQRIYVIASVYENFKSLLIDEIKKLKIGNPEEEGTVIGPLIDKTNLRRIEAWVKEAVNDGATILLGGEVFNENDNIYSPTLIEGIHDKMKIVCDEVFGPIAIIEKVKDFAEAIQKTNQSKYGLQAGVYTSRIDRMQLAHLELEVGGIMINNIPGFRMDNMPYGGVKASGFGREGIRYAMEEMTELRLLVY